MGCPAEKSGDNRERRENIRVRILKKNPVTGISFHDWKTVPVRDAIERETSKKDVRCKGCHGRVKLLSKHVDVGNAPHAVHHSRQDSSYCPLGFYFKQAKDGREPRLSLMPVK